MRRAATALVILASLVTGSAAAQTSPTADIRDASGQTIATATFTQAQDQVLIALRFRDRFVLVGTHAIQIHSNGRCDPPGFESAGPIFNPNGRQHGLQNPDGPMAGDLANLAVSTAGVAVYNVSAPLLTLDSLRGRSLLIFAGPDDGTSQPEGNAGARIACGVIGGNGERRDLLASGVVAVLGGLLIAAGVVLRRGA